MKTLSLVVVCAFLVLFPQLGWGFTRTHYVCEDSQAAAGAHDGSDWANCFDGFADVTWDAADDGDGDVGPNDKLELRDDDGVYREQLTIGASGLSGKPITIGIETGDTPIISGADLVSTWTEKAWFDAHTSTALGAESNGLHTFVNNRDIITPLQHGTNVRFTFKAGNAEMTIDGASICQRNGATDDCTAAPIRITFNTGNHDSGAVAANNTVTSDEMDLSGLPGGKLAAGTTYLIITCWADTYSYAYSATGGSGLYQWAGATQNDTLTQVVSYGGIVANYVVCITKAEVELSNVWQVALGTEAQVVLMDGALGIEESGACPSALSTDTEWCWDASVLYQYSTSDPDIRYTSPGTTAGQRSNAIYLDNKDYITVDGITVQEGNTHGIHLQNGVGNFIIQNSILQYNAEVGVLVASLTTQDDGLIDSNIARYNGEGGVYIGQKSDGYVVSRNALHNNSWNPDEGFTYGFKAWSNKTSDLQNTTIEYNAVYDNGRGEDNTSDGSGIWIDDCYATSGNENIIRYNLIYDNDSYGIQLEKTDYTLVYGNVLYNNTLVGDWGANIGVLAYDGEHANNNKIFNNSLYGSNYWGIKIEADTGAGTDLSNNEFINNISDNSTHHELYAVGGGANDTVRGSGNVYNSNSFGTEYANFINWDGQVSTYDAFIAASSQTDNNVEADPLFTNAAGDDFRLKHGSPCIGAGVDLGKTYQFGLSYRRGPATNPRLTIQGTKWDIGAYVYSRSRFHDFWRSLTHPRSWRDGF